MTFVNFFFLSFSSQFSLENLGEKRAELAALKTEESQNLAKIKTIDVELENDASPPTAARAADLEKRRLRLKERNDQIITDKAILAQDIRTLEGMFLIFLFIPFSCKTVSLLLARTHRRQQQDTLGELQAFLWEILAPGGYWNNRNRPSHLHRNPAALPGMHLPVIADETDKLMKTFSYAPGPDKKHIYSKDEKRE